MSVEETTKPGDITSNPAVTKEEVKIVGKAKGLYNVTFLKDHGTKEEGDEAQMHYSTAKALKAHKVLKIGSKIEEVKKVKR